MHDPSPSDVPRRLTSAAATLAVGAVVVDVAGLVADNPALWTAGSWLHLVAAVVLSAALLAAALPPLYRGIRRSLSRGEDRRPVGAGLRLVGAGRGSTAGRIVLLAAALGLLGVGRWIRGYPAVPPDLPIVAAAALATLLLGLALTRPG